MPRDRQDRAAALCLALAMALLPAGSAPALSQSAAQPLIRGGEAPELFLLYTGDVIGYLGPCG
jgi:hypothetical protein